MTAEHQRIEHCEIILHYAHRGYPHLHLMEKGVSAGRSIHHLQRKTAESIV